MNNLKQQNHFEKFSFAISFEIDLQELERKYLQFQMEFHPDKSSLGDAENSVTINEAYEILKDPIRRGNYILKLNGIDVEKDPSDVKPDLALLEKVLDLQEKIDVIKNKESAKQLKEQINKELQILFSQISDFLKKSEWQKAALRLIEAKYLKKSLADLKNKEKLID